MRLLRLQFERVADVKLELKFDELTLRESLGEAYEISVFTLVHAKRILQNDVAAESAV